MIKATTFMPTVISLTDTAAAHLRKKLAQDSNAIAFRISVKDAGCNSKMYVTELAYQQQHNDIEVIDHDIKVFVEKPALPFIVGTEVDYVRDGINRVLKFNNPNVTSACGCGESFNV